MEESGQEKTEKRRRFVAFYLWQNRKWFFLFLVFVLLFWVSFLLYHLPAGAVLYPAALCGLLFLLFAVWDLGKSRVRHQRLLELRKLPGNVMEDFPEITGQEDEDYQELIRLLREEERRLKDDMDQRLADMTDYYTVWVHQIKTPIAAMRLRLRRQDSEENRQLLGELSRIEQYVEMVLCYLRLDSDTTDYVFREYDLDAILRQAVKKYAGQFILKKITLNYQPLGLRVVTDEKWLLFVIEQILSNALKYTVSGTVTIELEGETTLCIRDTGIGIDAADLPRIFEKGYTGDNGRRDKRASGLGLYLCRRICRNLGHEIWAASQPEQGTALYLRFQKKI